MFGSSTPAGQAALTVQKKNELKYTRRNDKRRRYMNGELDHVNYQEHPVFNLQMPVKVAPMYLIAY